VVAQRSENGAKTERNEAKRSENGVLGVQWGWKRVGRDLVVGGDGWWEIDWEARALGGTGERETGGGDGLTGWTEREGWMVK
jgi:hypothetical protein